MTKFSSQKSLIANSEFSINQILSEGCCEKSDKVGVSTSKLWENIQNLTKLCRDDFLVALSSHNQCAFTVKLQKPCSLTFVGECNWIASYVSKYLKTKSLKGSLEVGVTFIFMQKDLYFFTIYPTLRK